MRVFHETAGFGLQQLVVLHGWGLHGAVWNKVAPTLRTQFRVTIPDLPGFGRSRMFESDYSLSFLASSISALVDGAAVWVGWSLGGLVALEAACRFPERVRALMLVASSPRFTQAENWPHGMPKQLLTAFAEDLERDYRGTLSRFLLLQAGQGEHAREVAKHLRQELFRHGEPHPQALRGALSILRDADLRDCASDLRCPVAVVLGGRDTLVPAAVANDLKRLWPDWRIHTLPDSSHAPFLSHPAQFSSLVKRFAHDLQ